jgi:hypothetical protein
MRNNLCRRHQFLLFLLPSLSNNVLDPFLYTDTRFISRHSFVCCSNLNVKLDSRPSCMRGLRRPLELARLWIQWQGLQRQYSGYVGLWYGFVPRSWEESCCNFPIGTPTDITKSGRPYALLQAIEKAKCWLVCLQAVQFSQYDLLPLSSEYLLSRHPTFSHLSFPRESLLWGPYLGGAIVVPLPRFSMCGQSVIKILLLLRSGLFLSSLLLTYQLVFQCHLCAEGG